MTRRLLLVLWIVIAAGIWNVVFDLHVSRGERQYLRLVAEATLGLREAPSLREVTTTASREGVRAASTWALIVLGTGCLSVWTRPDGKSEVRSKKSEVRRT